ncbi:MAG: hypothetical protein ACK5XV_12325 [Flavobacteriales bacterium]
MENKSSRGPRLVFPTWKSLIVDLISDYAELKGLPKSDIQSMIVAYNRKIEVVKRLIKSESPIISMGSALTSDANYFSGPDTMAHLEKLRSARLGTNEFYAIYDLAERRYSYVDPDVRSCLGIVPEKFTVESILGILPDSNLCHPDDSPHNIRWAGIAYLILSMPAFTFRSLNEYFKISFRINTEASLREDLRSARSAVFEKCCYLTICESLQSSLQPRFHIDRCAIYDKSSFTYVRPTFVSDFVQSEFLNILAFLINAEILGISPKHVLILEEKSRNDRNKAVANEINEGLSTIAGINDFEFTEYQIADMMSKTVRNRVAEVLNTWRKPKSPILANSDSDAVELSKILGIVSIPTKVKRMIYEGASVDSSKS